MFTEMDILHDSEHNPYKEPIDERARRYDRELEEGKTILSYNQWIKLVWFPNFGTKNANQLFNHHKL